MLTLKILVVSCGIDLVPREVLLLLHEEVNLNIALVTDGKPTRLLRP
jgi:hypothetical protein